MKKPWKKSAYEVLGVSRTADEAAIAQAFRRESKRRHPDAGGGVAEFQELQSAYALLKDRDRRARYDASGDESEATPNQALVVLLNEFRKCLMAWVQKPATWAGEDLRETMVASLRQQMNAGAAAIGESRARLEKLEALARLVKFKGEGLDIIGEELRGGIENLRSAIVAAERGQVDLEAAIVLAQDYEFPVERPKMGAGARFVEEMYFQHGSHVSFNGMIFNLGGSR